jgi:guanylate kinase
LENSGNYGKLLIFSAPSGGGKTTIVKHLLSKDFKLEFSISATTRKKRAGETNGVDYYFISVDAFKKKINNGEFLEWEEVYKDHFYGTLKSEVDRIWEKGNHVIFDVDVYGGINIKNHYGDKALSVFVMPPNLQKLEERLRKRSTENAVDLQTRVDKAKHELTFAGKFDVILINDQLSDALAEAEKIVGEFLIRKS